MNDEIINSNRTIAKNGIALAATLTVANFGWQFFFGQDWGAALERSYFQAWAIWIFGACLLRSPGGQS